MLRYTRIAMLAVFALATPAALQAQGQSPPNPEVQGWIAEIQQLQAQLAPLEQQALQDAELAQQQEELNTALRSAMAEADPTLEAKGERMMAIQQEAQAAQEAGDAERLTALTAEAEAIQTNFAEVQMQVLEDPTITARVDAFRSSVQARMIEIDPEAEALLNRANELNTRITEAMGQPAG